ncbi:MAG: stage III sporulation protein AB [Oscillospiraceae bacterium]|jgi:stage III sporulation protein AB|nr:stage III sporulation protein AB [Oscillospiraceae bacterium]
MVRIVGAVLMMAGTTAWGLDGVMKLRGRCKSLRAITSALGVMRSEICDRLTPVSELAEALGAQAQYPVNIFFQNLTAGMRELGNARFSEIWQNAVTGTVQLQLTAREAITLSELGLSIGRYDVDEQRDSLLYVQRQMEEYAALAESTRSANSKLRAFLGVAVGIFAIIIFI